MVLGPREVTISQFGLQLPSKRLFGKQAVAFIARREHIAALPIELCEALSRENVSIWGLVIDELLATGLLDFQRHLSQVLRRQLVPILDD